MASKNNSAMYPDAPPAEDDEDAVATNTFPAIDSGDDFTPSDTLFMDLKAKAREARDHADPWWKEVKGYYDLYAGRQWPEEDRQILESQLRPVVTFNRIGPVIDSYIGLEMNDRKQVQYYPRTMGDAKINELYTSAAMYVRERTDAEDEESDAFLDLGIAGMGWTDTHLIQDEDSQGRLDIRIDRIDPTEMAWDPNSKKRNLADARYLVRFRDIPLTEAEAMFPGFEAAELNASWASNTDSQELYDQPQKYLFNMDEATPESRSRQKVTIVELQWWEKRTYWKVLDPTTGEIKQFDDASYRVASKRWAELSKQMQQITGQALPPIQAAPYKRKIYRRAFLGNQILKIAPLPCPYSFSWNCMTGKRDRNKRYWIGLVRAMKDPQEWANKWLSQILHIINSNAKGGLMAPKNAFEDWRKVEANWARPDFIAWTKDASAQASIKQREQVQFPQGLYQLLDFAVSSIRDVNGFNLELLGMADRDQPASLEYQRRQSGMTVLAQFFNALRQYRKRQGRSMLYMIQKWLGDGRLIRITLDNGDEQYIPLLQQADEEVIEYDVVVDEVASSPNQKEMVWSMLVQMMPFLQQAQMPGQVWADLIRYSPLPDSLAQKIGSALNVPPDQAAIAFESTMKQLTLALAKANVNATEAQAALDAASARGKVASAQKDMAQADKISAETSTERMQHIETAVRAVTNAGIGGIPPSQSPFVPAMQPAMQ